MEKCKAGQPLKSSLSLSYKGESRKRGDRKEERVNEALYITLESAWVEQVGGGWGFEAEGWGKDFTIFKKEMVRDDQRWLQTLAASRKTVSLMCLTPLRITARATPAARRHHFTLCYFLYTLSINSIVLYNSTGKLKVCTFKKHTPY